MKGPILVALVMDAWQQVLDNRVFRLLLFVALLLILPTFLIGFHSEHIELLWGLGSIDYESLHGPIPGMRAAAARIEEPGAVLIQMFQDLVVTSFAGTLGVVLAIAATAFFMPRMMEKGSADTLFSKPVARWVLLLSRYLSGLLFVAALSFLLVFGMYLGFRVTSGYDDPGFLWSALTLVYLYSALHAFSLLVATFTRSSVAAILLTIVLFSFSGCIHGVWITKEQYEHDERLQAMVAAMTSPEAAPLPLDELLEEPLEQELEEPPEEGDAELDEDSGLGETVKAILWTTLDVLHYTLPKTTDADFLVRKLKASFELPTALEDPEGLLTLTRGLSGWRLVTPGRVDLSRSAAVWVPSEAEEGSPHGLRLTRRPRAVETDGRRRTLNAMGVSSELVERLRADPDALDPARESLRLSGAQTYIVRWRELGEGGALALEGEPEAALARERWIFAYRDWLFELDATLPPELAPEGAPWRSGLRHNLALGQDAGLDPRAWYERRFKLDAPLRYNPLFSVGSTLAFALVSLLLASFKLSRLDF